MMPCYYVTAIRNDAVCLYNKYLYFRCFLYYFETAGLFQASTGDYSLL